MWPYYSCGSSRSIYYSSSVTLDSVGCEKFSTLIHREQDIFLNIVKVLKGVEE